MQNQKSQQENNVTTEIKEFKYSKPKKQVPDLSTGAMLSIFVTITMIISLIGWAISQFATPKSATVGMTSEITAVTTTPTIKSDLKFLLMPGDPALNANYDWTDIKIYPNQTYVVKASFPESLTEQIKNCEEVNVTVNYSTASSKTGDISVTVYISVDDDLRSYQFDGKIKTDSPDPLYLRLDELYDQNLSFTLEPDSFIFAIHAAPDKGDEVQPNYQEEYPIFNNHHPGIRVKVHFNGV